MSANIFESGEMPFKMYWVIVQLGVENSYEALGEHPKIEGPMPLQINRPKKSRTSTFSGALSGHVRPNPD